ncbi:MAG TPA: alpha/beta hydrolase-fold protein [Gemmatimonadales bacterium]|nr:alpha/beta hydrolase-fold protein [Gemmatimonadales bacterium]
MSAGRGAGALGLALLLAASAASAQGRVVVDTLHSTALEGNRLGDSPVRAVHVYLPPSYDREPSRRYAVLYLLHGMTSHPTEWLDGSYQGFDLRAAMDSLAGAGAVEFLVVMPHADNADGGTFYVNSAAYGGWEEFVAQELVAFTDARYRTTAHRAQRGLAGQSMGGFGALLLAHRHPDVFGSVYAMSACCLGFVGELAQGSAAWSGKQPARLRTMGRALAPPGTPGLDAPMPFAPDSGGSVREVAVVSAAWRRSLPLELAARAPAPYGTLCGLALDYGSRDAIASVPEGSRAFSAALARAGIGHVRDEYDGGHVDRARARFEAHLLPFFAAAFARGCDDVQPPG